MAKEKCNPNDSSTDIKAAPLLHTPIANLPIEFLFLLLNKKNVAKAENIF